MSATTGRSAAKDPSAALFYASRDRTGEHPDRHLASYAGVLQAHLFDDYNRPYLPDRKPGPIVEALCWSLRLQVHVLIAAVLRHSPSTICQ